MFYKALVHQVISNNNEIDDGLAAEINSLTNINVNLASQAPNNSILCSFLKSEIDASGTSGLILSLPFFSSHMQQPVKPGEIVWVYNANRNSSNSTSEINFYWLSRVHGTNISEDANFSHFFRDFSLGNEDTSSLDALQKIKEVNVFESPKNDLGTFTNEGEEGLNENNQVEEQDKFEPMTILENEDAGSLLENASQFSYTHTIEPIPRYTKKPGDFLIQGSNNNVIRMSSGEVTNVVNEISEPTINIANTASDSVLAAKSNQQSGNIDIFVGNARYNNILYNKLDDNRQYSTHINELGFPVVKNESDLFEYENAKDIKRYVKGLDIKNPKEGDSDFINDASRIYISSKEDINGKLNIRSNNLQETYSFEDNAKKKLEFDSELSCALVKSDQVRIVARNNIQYSNSSYDSRNPTIENKSGDIIILKEGDRPAEGSKGSQASVILLNDGSILIDGSKIIIGDDLRKTQGEGAESHGRGEQILLGQSANEPLVLGNSLKSSLENFMNEMIETLSNLSTMMSQAQNHIHPTGTGPSSPPVDITPWQNEKVDLDTRIQNLENQKNELFKILSKFGKTL